jgi:hypothetical protein
LKQILSRWDSDLPAQWRSHAAAAGVIFSGQKFYRAQSQNCESKKAHARPARKTGGDSGEIVKIKVLDKRESQYHWTEQIKCPRWYLVGQLKNRLCQFGLCGYKPWLEWL